MKGRPLHPHYNRLALIWIITILQVDEYFHQPAWIVWMIEYVFYSWFVFRRRHRGRRSQNKTSLLKSVAWRRFRQDLNITIVDSRMPYHLTIRSSWFIGLVPFYTFRQWETSPLSHWVVLGVRWDKFIASKMQKILCNKPVCLWKWHSLDKVKTTHACHSRHLTRVLRPWTMSRAKLSLGTVYLLSCPYQVAPEMGTMK